MRMRRVATSVAALAVLLAGLSAEPAVTGAAAAGLRPGTAATACKPKPKKPCKKHAAPKPKPAAPPVPAALVQRLAAGGAVTDLVDAFGSLWVRVGATVERIDPATNAVVARIPVGSGSGLAAGAGALWAPSDPNTVTRIDAATNAVVATIALPNADPRTVAVTPGAVWVGMAGPPETPGELVHVDPTTNAVTGRVPLKKGALYSAAVGNVVWVVDQDAIAHFDAGTGELVSLPGAIANTVGCGSIAGDGGGVWVSQGKCGLPRWSLEKLDAKTDAVLVRPEIATARGMALGLGSVWVATDAHTLLRIDPSNGKVTGSMRTDLGESTTVAVAFGSIWVADGSGVLERFEPK
jgi:hypothetical protein